MDSAATSSEKISPDELVERIRALVPMVRDDAAQLNMLICRSGRSSLGSERWNAPAQIPVLVSGPD